MRAEHCPFAVLNNEGRCIAECYLQHNGVDCIGNEWKPDYTQQSGHEIALNIRRAQVKDVS